MRQFARFGFGSTLLWAFACGSSGDEGGADSGTGGAPPVVTPTGGRGAMPGPRGGEPSGCGRGGATSTTGGRTSKGSAPTPVGGNSGDSSEPGGAPGEPPSDAGAPGAGGEEGPGANGGEPGSTPGEPPAEGGAPSSPDCAGTGGSGTGGAGNTTGGGGSKTGEPPQYDGVWPKANQYSWDGSWTPETSDFPLDGLFDDFYFDAHLFENQATPILPPGLWDYGSGRNLSNYSNFASSIGTFRLLVDSSANPFGWTIDGKTPDQVAFTGPGAYFEGSSGADWLLLGTQGSISSIGGTLGDGPDVLVTASSFSLDYRTGSTLDGSQRDNDLLILGCEPHPNGDFSIETTTFHTGPGSDWVFVRDIDRAAIDLGNGDGGKTTVVDPNDGNDLVVLRGNTHDFRVFGGGGSDTFVWYPDENVQTAAWLAPSFFGGGGDDAAVWDDGGIDRLVMVVPTTTEMVTRTPTPNGGLLVQPTSGEHIEDGPTQGDVYARYCQECSGPNGLKTVRIEYNSADGEVRSGYFAVSSVEELQVGVGPEARVYKLDSVTGTATLDESLPVFVPPTTPACSDAAALMTP